MSNEINVKEAKEIIDRIFENKTISRDQTLEDLKEIEDYCEMYTFNLGLDKAKENQI